MLFLSSDFQLQFWILTPWNGGLKVMVNLEIDAYPFLRLIGLLKSSSLALVLRFQLGVLEL